jgi:hypothetical protein
VGVRTYQFKAVWGLPAGASGPKRWIEGKWVEEEPTEAAFKEPFHAFAFYSLHYFVTESGRLYFSVKNGKEARTNKVVWGDKKPPITHAITDVDSGRTFLFFKGPDSRGEARVFFFELSPFPNPSPVDPASLPKVKADEPLRTVTQYAGVLSDWLAQIKRAQELRADPKLRVKFRLVEVAPELHDLLGRLAKATGLTFELDSGLANHHPQLGDVQFASGTVDVVMRLLARVQLEEGRWVKTPSGYRLTAIKSLAPSPEEVVAVEKAKKKYVDFVESHPLRQDPRLQMRLSIEESDPELPDLLARLQSVTGLTIALGPSLAEHRPLLGSLQLPKVHAWLVMELLAEAQVEGGRWEKTDNGYRLVGKSLVPSAALGPNRWRIGGVLALSVALLFGLLVFLRYRLPPRRLS